MKPTKIEKKLGLKKEIIATLNHAEAKLVNGGAAEEVACPGPVCGSGSAYYYWQTIASCPVPNTYEVPVETCIL